MNYFYDPLHDEVRNNQKRVKDIINNLGYLHNLLIQIRKKEDVKFKRFCSAMQDVINNPEQYS